MSEEHRCHLLVCGECHKELHEVDALHDELELARKIADEAIKQTEILTKQLGIAMKALNITATYRNGAYDICAKEALAEINRIGGKNE